MEGVKVEITGTTLQDRIAARIVETHAKSPLQLEVAIREALHAAYARGRSNLQSELRRLLGVSAS